MRGPKGEHSQRTQPSRVLMTSESGQTAVVAQKGPSQSAETTKTGDDRPQTSGAGEPTESPSLRSASHGHSWPGLRLERTNTRTREVRAPCGKMTGNSPPVRRCGRQSDSTKPAAARHRTH